MKTKNRWQRNRANGEFWLAWASEDNRLHTIGTNYYRLCIAWNNWRIRRIKFKALKNTTTTEILREYDASQQVWS